MKNIQPVKSNEESENKFKTMREANIESIPCGILATLIEEVRNEKFENISAYNRFHNRHNRSR